MRIFLGFQLRISAWIFAGAIAGPPALAATTPALVAEMLANAPMAAENRCGYVRYATDEDGSTLERFDPSGDNGLWTLLAIDDRQPAPRELHRYADKAEKRAARRHPLGFDLTDMVQDNSWALVSETEDEAVYSFRLKPDEDLDEDLVEKVLGTLTLDKHRVQPRRILVEASGPAYVAPMVRIAAYRQELRFSWNHSVGAAALAEKITHRRGRALGLRSLRKDKRVLYSDYECAVYAEEVPRGMPLEN